MHEERYYRPSGAVPFVGTLLMLLCGGVAAAALAFAYGLLTAYNPYIYLTFIGTVLFGLGMGGAVVMGAVAGRVRNRLFAILVAACIGLLGLYLSWVFFIPYMYRQLNVPGIPFSFDPAIILDDIQVFAENGLWTITGWTPKGWTLYAFWLVEAAIILVAAIVPAATPRNPFCEVCRRWTEEHKPSRPLALTDPDSLRTALEQEHYEILDQLRDGEIAPENCLRVTLHACPQCSESNYLTVSHVRQTTSRDGNVQTQSADLVRRLCIPDALVEHLRVALNEPAVTFAPPTGLPGLPGEAAPGDTAVDEHGIDEIDEAQAASDPPERSVSRRDSRE